MFSKALFKQSCKANGTMWAIITFAVCFMLACVMLISGSGGIGDTKNAIQDTIIRQEIDAQLEKRSLNYYGNATDGLGHFDGLFAQNAQDALTYNARFTAWTNARPVQGDKTDEEYNGELAVWKNTMPAPEKQVEQLYAKNYSDWTDAMPKASDYDNTDDYTAALTAWNAKNPASQQGAVTAAYQVSVLGLKNYMYEKAKEVNPAYTEDTNEAAEILGSVMFALNPKTDGVNGMFDETYTEWGEDIPDVYDVTSIVAHIATGDVADYLAGEERLTYVRDRAESSSMIFLAGNMTSEENVKLILDNLASFGVTEEKYNTFGYDYANIKHMAATTVITYRNRLDYEVAIIEQNKADGKYATEEEYTSALKKASDDIIGDVSNSLLESLPQEVSDALQEIGKADLYTLIVGSIYFKLAGLLLPIIFMIMASNNLIAGQVDSGSMAYVLSTSTKRKTIVFTQALYLIGSLFAMFCLTTVTSCVCLAIVIKDVQLTYGKLLLLNLGAFLVLVALSGLCFLTSCFFDRSKKSMAIGGGLSIFALVAAMLGLFGSAVIPSVIRLEALDFFNYTTIISLFDVVSIMDGTTTFIWKFAILVVLGVTGYILGAKKFVKKDLPL